MFDEPDEVPEGRAIDPKQRAEEKAGEFRIHAEVCAVFEGPRKFDAQLVTGLEDAVARDIQRRIAKLEKAKSPESPIVPPASAEEAVGLLKFPETGGLSTGDYHVCRRPGEVMIARWLEGEQVETFYQRLQAHFDAALEGYREEERQMHGWKQDPQTLAYLNALDGVEMKMADRYLRDAIRKHGIFVLSTATADEMDILHLSDYVMGVAVDDLVGEASAPPGEATEQDRAWFFRLFSLRGIVEGVERMCFFAYMQKSDDSGW